MKTIVLYDSAFGNTEKIARAIGAGAAGNVEVHHISEINPFKIEPGDFLFIGSPTQGGKAKKSMEDFLNMIPSDYLKATKVAVFDTRLPGKLVGVFGYAANRIASILRSRGALLAASPEGFLVSGKEGPLKEGELERAASWAKETIGTVSAAAM